MTEFHPAKARPGMYAGPQGTRTRSQWEADALAVYNSKEGLIIDMDRGKRK